MEYRVDEIVQIAVETVEESIKDAMDLENRRPVIHQTATLIFDIIDALARRGDKVPGMDTSSRDLRRGETLQKALSKLEGIESE